MVSALEVLDQAGLLESILDGLAEGVLVVDPDNYVLFANASARRLLEAAGASAESLVERVAGETITETEVFLSAPGAAGGLWLSLRARPLPDAGGILIVFRDISRRRTREERQWSMIEQVSDVIAVFDLDATIRYQSPSTSKVLGYGPDELLGRNAFELIHPEDSERLRELHLASLAQPGKTCAIEYRIRHRDGSWRLVEGVGRAFRDETGAITGVVATLRDITDRKRIEEQVAFQASLLEQVPSAVVALDNRGQVLYWNRRAEELSGWKREEVLGRPFMRLESAPPVPEQWQRVKAALEASGRWEGEIAKRRRDNSTFPAHLIVSLVRNEAGRVIGKVGVATDISDWKKVQQQLEDSHDQMRRLAARLESVREVERTRLAREIHDQLGQNLTALKFELAQIGRRLAFEAELAGAVKAASAQVDDIITLVQKIATELRPSILDDLGLAAAVEWQAQDFSSRTGIRCAVARRPSEINPSKNVATALFRVLQEILTNVARHSGATSVRVSLVQRRGHLLLVVHDNGCGIRPEQVAASSSLGLLGMRERALALGGDILIRGAAGEGTTVTVHVPWRPPGRKTQKGRRQRTAARRVAC